MRVATVVIERQSAKLEEAFRLLSKCVSNAYEGDADWFPFIALQLRKIYFDKSPLLERVSSEFELPAIQSIHVREPLVPMVTTTDDGVIIRAPFVQYMTPVEVTVDYPKGRYFVSLVLDLSKPRLRCSEWGNQVLSSIPTLVSVRDVVRTVCDKGGGAHADERHDAILSYLNKVVPIPPVLPAISITYANIFLLALARFTLVLAKKLGCAGQPNPVWWTRDARAIAFQPGEFVHQEKHEAHYKWLSGFSKNPLRQIKP